MTKTIVFDTGPIISLTMNGLIHMIEPLQKKYGGDFIITNGVYSELIEKPLSTKKYKFEALQVLPYISGGVIKNVDSGEIRKKAQELFDAANSCFRAHGSWIKIVHIAEMEALSAAIIYGAEAIVIDERTTRTLIESPDLLKSILEKKLHTEISVNEANFRWLKGEIGSLPVLRSFELAAIAYELGLFDPLMLDEEKKIVPNIRRAVLEGVLWALKLNGCSVKREDIYDLVELELNR